jgi:hypothetical protein
MPFMAIKRQILEYKRFYQGIGSVQCPYFEYEQIFFNRKGLNHIMRKGRELRTSVALMERLSLLRYCKEILEDRLPNVEYRISRKQGIVGRFWAFTSRKEDREIRLIVRQVGDGRKHFFGIFPVRKR